MVNVEKTLKQHWPKILTTFVIGGLVLATVEFIAKYVDNAAWAAVAGAFPTGLISMYLVKSCQSQKYANDYFYVTSILLFSTLVFFLIRSNMDVWNEARKYIVVSGCLVFYIILVYFRTRYASKQPNPCPKS
jgi:hypothetical protein